MRTRLLIANHRSSHPGPWARRRRWLAAVAARGSLLAAATYAVVRGQVEAGPSGTTLALLPVLSALVAGGLTALLFLGRDRAMILRLSWAEKDRAAAARHFERFFALAGDIFLLVDPAGRIVEANEAAVAAYGYSRDELLTMTLYELRAPERRAEIERDGTAAARPGGVQFQTVHQRRDGIKLPVEVRSSTLEVGGALYRQKVIRDIA